MKLEESFVQQTADNLWPIYEARVKAIHKKIEVLYARFDKRVHDHIFKTRHATCFGLFIAEYVSRLPICTRESSVDEILLNARRLCEVLITVQYFNQKNNFEKMVEYCDRDRMEYLEGCISRTVADEKLFVELKGMPDMNQSTQTELAQLKQKYINNPAKIPDMKKMAQAVDLEDEYNYFYKFTSKLLHFCPFSFNGDSPFEAPIHKVVFLMRSVRYMEKLKEELDTVYQKTILTN